MPLLEGSATPEAPASDAFAPEGMVCEGMVCEGLLAEGLVADGLVAEGQASDARGAQARAGARVASDTERGVDSHSRPGVKRGAGARGESAHRTLLPLDVLLEGDGPAPEAVEYLQEVETFFLSLRGVGLLLSPTDMQLVQEWQGAGYPLNKVLCGLHRGAERRMKAQKPVRTLRSLRTQVEKEIFGKRRAASPGRSGGGKGRRKGKGRGAQAYDAAFPADPLLSPFDRAGEDDGWLTAWTSGKPAARASSARQEAVLETFMQFFDEELLRLAGLGEALAVLPPLQALMLETQATLEASRRTLLDEGAGPELIMGLLSLGKDFYLRLWEELPDDDREEILAEAQAHLRAPHAGAEILNDADEDLGPDDGDDDLDATLSGPSGRGTSIAAANAAQAAPEVDETLRTLLLRLRFGILEPARLCGLWDALEEG